MEKDRYGYNHKLYIAGIISLIIALALLFFSLYMLPFLVLGFKYDVPDFVGELIRYFIEEHHYSPLASKALTWIIFFIPSIIAWYVSSYISNYIDIHVLGLDKEVNTEEQRQLNEQSREDLKESFSLALKIIMLMLVIIIAIFLLQAFLSVTS